jgi:hypothetical protein
MQKFSIEANAVVCAKAVVKAGCAGPNGAAVVTKPVLAPPPAPASTADSASNKCSLELE